MHIDKKTNSLNQLEKWFGKNLTGDQFAKLLEHVEYIPAPALHNIVDRIISENPPMPSRFPTVEKIREHWQIWRKENPKLAARHPITACGQCDRKGFIWGIKKTGDIAYEYVFRCAACENWQEAMGRNSVVPLANRQQLFESGYLLRR